MSTYKVPYYKVTHHPPPRQLSLFSYAEEKRMFSDGINAFKKTSNFVINSQQYATLVEQELEETTRKLEQFNLALWPVQEECILMANDLCEGGMYYDQYAGGSIDWLGRDQEYEKRKKLQEKSL